MEIPPLEIALRKEVRVYMYTSRSRDVIIRRERMILDSATRCTLVVVQSAANLSLDAFVLRRAASLAVSPKLTSPLE